MALEKVKVTVGINVTEGNVVEVKEQVRVLEDGEILSSSTNRYTVPPDQLPPDDADEKVKAVCALVHTEEAKQAYLASVETI